MFNPEDLLNDVHKLERGISRIRALKKAIAVADSEKNLEWQFKFRHECVSESVFYSDGMDSIVIFPQEMALIDENPDILSDYKRSLMWDFKYILGTVDGYYNVPLEEIRKLFDEFSKRCDKWGYSQRTCEYLKEKTSIKTGNFLKKGEYGKFDKYKEDDLKDCAACERSFLVKCALMNDDEEQAKAFFEPIFNGDLRCAEVPQITYFNWIEYYVKKGNYAEALNYAKRLYSMIKGDVSVLECVGCLLTLYSKVDLQTGLNIFSNELKSAMSCRKHYMKYKFCEGAYRLFKEIGNCDINLVLTTDFPLWNKDKIYNSEKLRDYFYNQAKEIAEKFDARNGNNYYITSLEEVLPDYDSKMEIYSGYVNRSPSIIGAVCGEQFNSITLQEIISKIESADYTVEMVLEGKKGEICRAQIRKNENIYNIMVLCIDIPNVEEFKLLHYINEGNMEDIYNSKSVLITIVDSLEKEDLIFQTQLEILGQIIPNSPGYIDYSRQTFLSGKWARLQAQSTATPLAYYLYNIDIIGSEDEEFLWIYTKGLNCLGIRNIECFDATKDNYGYYCRFIEFLAERFAITGELTNAKTPFHGVRRDNMPELECAWIPYSQIRDFYPDENQKGTLLKEEHIQEIMDNPENAVILIYSGQNMDGSVKLSTMDCLSEEDFENFLYGSYYNTDNKIAIYAKERSDLFAKAFDKNKENAYVCVEDDEGKYVWMKVLSINGNKVEGTLEYDCSLGKEGTKVIVDSKDYVDFDISVDDNSIRPDSAYLFDE